MIITNVIIITASEGHMLTNGETYGKSVSLGKGDSIDNWHEVTYAEYEKWRQNQNLIDISK
jgi:hypothetical protein